MEDPDTDTETDTAVLPATPEPEPLRRAKRERERGNLSGIRWSRITKHLKFCSSAVCCVVRGAVRHNAGVLVIIIVTIHNSVMSL